MCSKDQTPQLFSKYFFPTFLTHVRYQSNSIPILKHHKKKSLLHVHTSETTSYRSMSFPILLALFPLLLILDLITTTIHPTLAYHPFISLCQFLRSCSRSWQIRCLSWQRMSWVRWRTRIDQVVCVAEICCAIS